MPRIVVSSLLFLTALAAVSPAAAYQATSSETSPVATSPLPDGVIEQMKFRSVGPFRGGRSAAVEGVRGNATRFYMGACGGGVWTTGDGGSTWKNISDGFFGGSIGAIAVAPSDSNVIYVGGGEVTVRGNVSHGDGIWKTVDAGKTWKQMGLSDSRHIPRIRIHPQDPNTVYATALGHLYGANGERGVYRSRDGGATWQRILYVNDEVGACDLVMDPTNPRVLYASTWRILRTPYSLESGGEGSALWKSTDAGDTWQDISKQDGLPGGPLGIIGVAVSPVNPDRVWAMIEAPEGGLFRSDDAGEKWSRINDNRDLRQRAWYYTRVFADPQEIDGVYVVNVSFHHSRDGGKTFDSISTPHGDHHDLWIDPDDNQRLIVADDGGAQVSFNGGETFSTCDNQPTAQFYRVTSDNHYPWRIYGAQQDNSAIRLAHRGRGAFLSDSDWESTAGGESGHLAPDPNDPDIVYGGSYGGFLSRINHKTGETRNVDVWPDNPMGHGAIDAQYRFQWNFPIFFSRHDPTVLYAAANVLFKTTNGGQSWTQVSPDLTRNQPKRLGPSGGPITRDNTGVEYYCTIFASTESVQDPAVLWSGSDDGLVQVTRDGGANWANVTPPEMPEWAQINSLDADPFEPGGLYVAATAYKSDDFRPYLFVTKDFGANWKRIDSGIPRDQFTRVVRADAARRGLLYAGTERGLFVSVNDGALWQPLQNNLPIVPVTDLMVRDQSLVVATQGRAFWMIDDLSLLQTFDDSHRNEALHVYQPLAVDRISGGVGQPSLTAGANRKTQGEVLFWLKDVPAEKVAASVKVFDAAGREAAVFVAGSKPEKGQSKLELKAGWNRLAWNLRYPAAETFEGIVLWGGGTGGPEAAPGPYKFEFAVGELAASVPLLIRRDPRSSASDEDLAKQFEFLLVVRNKLTEIHESITKIRQLRTQLSEFSKRFEKREDFAELVKQAGDLSKRLTDVEESLYQTQNRSGQDPLNFPIRLNNRLSSLVGVVAQGDNAPTEQAIRVRDELTKLIDEQLQKLANMTGSELDSFNSAANKLQVPLIFGGD